MKKKLKKGFTLVELVIVIAVIAILSAVLIPTFGNVIQNANDSAAFSTASNALTKYTTSMAEAQQSTILPDGYVIVFKKDVTIKENEALGDKTTGAYVFRFESGSLKQVKDDESTKYTVSDLSTGLIDLTKKYKATSGDQHPLTFKDGKASYFGMYMLDGSVVGTGTTSDPYSVKGRVLLLADAKGFTLAADQTTGTETNP